MELLGEEEEGVFEGFGGEDVSEGSGVFGGLGGGDGEGEDFVESFVEEFLDLVDV